MFIYAKRRDLAAKSELAYASGDAKKASISAFSSINFWKSIFIYAIITYIGLEYKVSRISIRNLVLALRICANLAQSIISTNSKNFYNMASWLSG